MKDRFFFNLLASTALILSVFVYYGHSKNADANPSKDLNKQRVVSKQESCITDNFSGVFNYNDMTATFEGNQISVPALAFENEKELTNVLGVANEERWIEVDLSEQRLTAWEGDRIFLETSVSSGLPHTPTPVGEFRIWIKLRATKMEGGQGRYYYYLPNVPYVMYFYNEKVPAWRGYGLHGTYWHNDFGNPRSHGCVNLPTPIAEQLYYWTSPVLPDGKSVVRSSADNLGTRIIIHQ